MSTMKTTTAVELTDRDVHLLKNALRSFESAFGHNEADVLHQIKVLLAKLDRAAPDLPYSTS